MYVKLLSKCYIIRINTSFHASGDDAEIIYVTDKWAGLVHLQGGICDENLYHLQCLRNSGFTTDAPNIKK